MGLVNGGSTCNAIGDNQSTFAGGRKGGVGEGERGGTCLTDLVVVVLEGWRKGGGRSCSC